MLTFARFLQGAAILFWAVRYWDPTLGAMKPDILARVQAKEPGVNTVARDQRKLYILDVCFPAVAFLGLLIEYLISPLSFGSLLVSVGTIGAAMAVVVYLHQSADVQLGRSWAELMLALGPDGTIPNDHPSWVPFMAQVGKIHSIGRVCFILVLLAAIATFDRFK